jgi:molybdate transport system substrate-binding protein
MLNRGIDMGVRPLLSLALLVCLAVPSAFAGDALIAVATNFSEVMERLESDFEKTGDHTLTVTTGSTGKLYAQIRNGAPFDVLLAADQRRPELLEEESRAVGGSCFTYAVGRLTLWSPDVKRVSADGSATLRAGAFRKLAIANPDLAPYGAAARETLTVLGHFDKLHARIVRGENVGQAHALVATGNADLGFVALSYVLSPRNKHTGSRWDVPQELYTPIRQDAVLLKHGAANPAARAFLVFLRTDAARAIIEDFGYGVD